ncbi:hypothetical protein ILYODFUR_029518 [Ilyodon furcidens]|uniref:Uncharacterized protein n=1 Tax=Ilyodon furcidens TaxID=33524 RepID=A0ABV0UB97_9TELE
MVTGSLLSVSMERGPGSVTGFSAINNDLVVCAAQECCNVWEYSTQSCREKKGEVGRKDSVCNRRTSLSPEYRAGQIHLVNCIKHLLKENNFWLRELAVREGLQRKMQACLI